VKFAYPARQSGVIVVVVLIFALLLSMLAAAGLRSVAMQARMAGNDQFQLEARYHAESIATKIAETRTPFSTALGVGQGNCVLGNLDPICNEYTLPAISLSHPTGAYDIKYQVVRQHPQQADLYPLLGAQQGAPGTPHSAAAVFEVTVDVDGSDNKLGSARIVYGVALPLLGAEAPLRIYWTEPGIDVL